MAPVHRMDTARNWKRAAQALKQAREAACPICRTVTAELANDHCHETGIGRERICRSCNLGLGHFKDNPEALRAAANYIERHRGADPLALMREAQALLRREKLVAGAP